MKLLKQLWRLANSSHCFCGGEKVICYKHDGEGDKCAICKHESLCHTLAEPVVPQATSETIRWWTTAAVVLIALTSLYFGAQML
jgi:hypothetical protein